MKGYNLIYTKIIELMDSPLAYKAIVDELLKLNTDDKVLRFIGGNEGQDLGYDKKVTSFFIKLCKDAEVSKVYLRVVRNKFEDAIRQYQDLTNVNIEVVRIEYGNEDSFNVKDGISGLESIFWNRFAWIRKNRTKSSAKQYAKEFIEFYNFCKGLGYDFKDKLVWNTHFKIDAINLTWHLELKKLLKEFKRCSIHVYGELDSNYWQVTTESILKYFKGLKIDVTEYHGLGFHNLSEKDKETYHGKFLQEEMHERANILFDLIGAEYKLVHTLFHFDHYKGYYGKFWINKSSGKITSNIEYL